MSGTLGFENVRLPRTNRFSSVRKLATYAMLSKARTTDVLGSAKPSVLSEDRTFSSGD